MIKILLNNINYELIISEKFKPFLRNKIKYYYNRKNFYSKMLNK